MDLCAKKDIYKIPFIVSTISSDELLSARPYHPNPT